MKHDLLIRDSADLRLETERLILRPFTAADMPTAIAHEKNRDIMHWIRDPLPDDEIERRCRAVMAPWRAEDGEWRLLVIEPKPSADAGDEMLGIVCLRVTAAENETLEIGYRLHPDVQRRGFGYEACVALIDYLFDRIEARKLVALCAAPNEPSWRLMAKLGMQREAELREYSFLAGAWQDEYVYGLLRREWRR